MELKTHIVPTLTSNQWSTDLEIHLNISALELDSLESRGLDNLNVLMYLFILKVIKPVSERYVSQHVTSSLEFSLIPGGCTLSISLQIAVNFVGEWVS